MRIKHCIAVAALVIVAAFVGCGKKTARTPAINHQPIATSSGATVKTSANETPLPAWAPKNPSPEFLRAAKVLKPVTYSERFAPAAEEPKVKIQLTRNLRLLPASYEFFGTLGDAQIKRFEAIKEVRIRAKSLTPKQLAALNHWFAEYREAMKGMPDKDADFLVNLYRLNAKEDLSNVDVGFRARSGHAVHLEFWIRQSDGRDWNSGWWFAQI